MSNLWVRAVGSDLDPDKIHDPSAFGAPLFHGSDREFESGDIIEPRSKKVAHATPHVRTARVWGGNVYRVEPVNQDSVWTTKMRHTQGEYHLEALSEDGFRVVGKIPKSRKDSYYEDERKQASESGQEWADRNGAVYCNECYGWHKPHE